MRCGNYVIGYHGFGGREYFRTDFSAPVETGDVLALARAVEAAIGQEAQDPGWLRARGLAASRFIETAYAPEAERQELAPAYVSLLGRQPDSFR